MYRNGPQIPMREGGGGGQAHVVLADAFSVMLVNIQVTTYFTTEFTTDFTTIHLKVLVNIRVRLVVLFFWLHGIAWWVESPCVVK